MGTDGTMPHSALQRRLVAPPPAGSVTSGRRSERRPTSFTSGRPTCCRGQAQRRCSGISPICGLSGRYAAVLAEAQREDRGIGVSPRNLASELAYPVSLILYDATSHRQLEPLQLICQLSQLRYIAYMEGQIVAAGFVRPLLLAHSTRLSRTRYTPQGPSLGGHGTSSIGARFSPANSIASAQPLYYPRVTSLVTRLYASNGLQGCY